MNTLHKILSSSSLFSLYTNKTQNSIATVLMKPFADSSDQTDRKMSTRSQQLDYSDVYSAALALVSLPKGSFSEANSDEDNSTITRQKSWDSLRSSNASSPFESIRSIQSELKNYPPVTTPAIIANDTPIRDQTISNSSAKSAFYGSIPLSMPNDEDNLSPLHCFVRKHGIEAFVVTEEEAQNKDFWYARNFKVKPSIVGMRCRYCSSKPIRDRGPKSVHYPSSIKCIYYSMENWQRHHAIHCSDVPKWVLRDLKKLMAKSKTGSGGRRRYWADSANLLGMIDTLDGIKFATNPEVNSQVQDISSDAVIQNDTSLSSSTPPSRLLITPKDKQEISDYLYLLMSQMETCSFSEEDRIGSRSKIKNLRIGYPGMQCKHCNGKAGVGRYFPVSLQNLTLANSDRNMNNHLEKCRRCPEDIRRKLQKLRNSAQKPNRKIKRGARKVFFTEVWDRLHKNNDDVLTCIPIQMPKLTADDATATKIEPNKNVPSTEHISKPSQEAPPISTSICSESDISKGSNEGRPNVQKNSCPRISALRYNQYRDTQNENPVPMIQVNNYTNFTHPMSHMRPPNHQGRTHPQDWTSSSDGRYNNGPFQFGFNAQVHAEYYCSPHNATGPTPRPEPLIYHQSADMNERMHDDRGFALANNRSTLNFAQL